MDFTFCRRKPCSSDGKIAIRNKSCSASMIVSNEIDGQYRKITEKQRNTIRGMLEGRAGLCFFCFQDSSMSEIKIKDNMLTISGGEYSLMFGRYTTLQVDYPANKAEVDKFLNFLLDTASNVSDDESDE